MCPAIIEEPALDDVQRGGRKFSLDGKRVDGALDETVETFIVPAVVHDALHFPFHSSSWAVGGDAVKFECIERYEVALLREDDSILVFIHGSSPFFFTKESFPLHR